MKKDVFQAVTKRVKNSKDALLSNTSPKKPEKQDQRNKGEKGEGNAPLRAKGIIITVKSFFTGIPSKLSDLLHKANRPSHPDSPATPPINKPDAPKKKMFHNSFLNKMFSIYFKLVSAFIVPVLLMIVLGVVSFMRASDAIISNYEDSVSQAVNMTKEYFNFAFTSLEAQINTYLFDKEIGEHLKGVNNVPQSQHDIQIDQKNELKVLEEKLDTLEEGTLPYYETYSAYLELKNRNDSFTRILTETELKQKDTYKKINSDMGTLAGSSPFIQNIFIINDNQDPLTTVLTLRRADGSDQVDEQKEKERKEKEANQTAEGQSEESQTEEVQSNENQTDESQSDEPEKEEYYTPFLKTDFGKKVIEKKTVFHWNGVQPELDEAYNIDSGKYCLRVAHACTDSATGYAIIDVSTSAIMGILNDLHIGEDSLLGIVTPDGQEIITMSTDAVSEEETKNAGDGGTVDTEGDSKEGSGQDSLVQEIVFSDKDFYQKVLDNELDSGLEYVRYKGSQYLFMYSKIGNTGNVLCALVPKSSIINQVSGIKTLTVILVILASIIALLIGLVISSSFSKTIKTTVKHLVTVSKGDLTMEIHMNRRDEFAQLADGMSEMIVNFRSLIQKLETVYRAFSEALHLVTDTSGTFSRTSKDIQTAIHEIEIGITQQSDDAIGCLEQMDSLFNRIGVVNENTAEINSIALTTNTAITESLSTMNDLKEKTRSTTDITNNVIQSIVDLEKKSRNIRQIVNAINDIAEETNLLSLNASIEAAKAGNAGRGFAVVADQIRKLADQSLVASSKINDIIEEIIRTTKTAAKTAEKAESIVNLQVSAVDNTSESFNTMSKRVEELTEKLTLIQSSVKSMENSGSATLHSMESISSILQETSAASTSVTEIVDKQTEALGDLDKAANLLMDRAKELDDAIHLFKTK